MAGTVPGDQPTLDRDRAQEAYRKFRIPPRLLPRLRRIVGARKTPAGQREQRTGIPITVRNREGRRGRRRSRNRGRYESRGVV